MKPFDQHELSVRIQAGIRLLRSQEQLLRTREALREQATTDSLTMLWNRSCIMEHLTGELDRSDRESRALGVILVDLDHFKNINDTFGHPAGDAVLRETAKLLRHAVRSYDSVGRYGGEEFLILLPGSDDYSTVAQAERLRSCLAEAKVHLPQTALTISASFGCTCAQPGRQLSVDLLIRRADEALYLAKRLGRNRAEFLSAYDALEKR